MKEIRNDSPLARALVYCGVALCLGAALVYLYRAYVMLF
jgi:hypothetical protein